MVQWMFPLDQIAYWPVDAAAAAWIAPDNSITTYGDTSRPFPLASITKLLTAMALLVAHEEGTLDLDEPLTAEGATTSDLLAHCSGMAPDSTQMLAAPRCRRIYSTAAYDVLAQHLAERAEMSFAEYVSEAVLSPLGMTAHQFEGSAGAAEVASVDDLSEVTRAWREPILVDHSTLTRAITVHCPHLEGALPGFGRQTPNPWCLGPEKRGSKTPHWTGSLNSEETYGHFGQTGTMLWIDPVTDHTLIALTDKPFGLWAATAWPVLSDAVLQTD